MIAVFGYGENDATVTAFRDDNGVLFPICSAVEGNGDQVVAYYGIESFHDAVLVKPNRAVVWNSDDVNLESIVDVTAQGPHQSACPDQWPIAQFSGAPLTIPINTGVFFTDESENPINQWIWEFENGTPASFDGQNPPEVIYNVPGWHNIKLTVRNEFDNENSLAKNDYVQVYEIADTTPVAWFSANQVIVIAGHSVNFTNLSWDFPFEWRWSFQGASPATSTIQHPHNITYNTAGYYDVQLIVRNSQGYDTLLIEDYIHVIPEVGLEIPVANFTTQHRLIKRNTPVVFQDLSTNNPMFWSWAFEGGDPGSSNSQLQPGGVLFSNTGFFDITLNVGNVNGSDMLTKRDYIVVYDSFVGSVCDTVKNLLEGEIPYAMQINGMSGYYGGQNSERITMYADYYDFHTFNEVRGVIVPVISVGHTSNNSYIRFMTWDGVDSKPTTVLADQKVFLRDLRDNYLQVIMFDEPLRVDGPFYLGYSINYAEGDEFVVGMAPNRGHGGENTLFVCKNGNWQSSPSAYNISTSSGIRPMTCLVGIEDETISENTGIYPNPSSDRLFVTNNLNFDQGDFVEIFDKTGKTVKMQFADSGTISMEMNVEDIAPGVYFARIFTKGRLIVEKVSIVR